MKQLLSLVAVHPMPATAVDSVRSQFNIVLADLDVTYLQTLLTPVLMPPSIGQPQGGASYFVTMMVQVNTREAWEEVEKRIKEPQVPQNVIPMRT